jgi:hypothetical protein
VRGCSWHQVAFQAKAMFSLYLRLHDYDRLPFLRLHNVNDFFLASSCFSG